MDLEKIVVVDNLVKIYPGGVRALDGLTFHVEKNEIYGLIGPNGAGKTTTLRIISTLLKPTSGRVLVVGYDVVREPAMVRRNITYLPEEAGAYRDLTGIEFLRTMLSLRFKGRELEEVVEEAAKISGLGKSLYRRVRTYSKGMKRSLLLALALAPKPKLAILDEPTSGLDVARSIELRNIIRRYRDNYGVTILLSSHNMLEVEYLCDRVGIIYRGKIIAEGAPEELKERYAAKNLEEVFLKALEEHGYSFKVEEPVRW